MSDVQLFDLPIAEVPVTTVATLDEGDFTEGLVMHPNGCLYASGLVSGRVYRVHPSAPGATGEPEVVWDFSREPRRPFGLPGSGADDAWGTIMTLCVAPSGPDAGRMFVAVLDSDPERRGLWEVDPDGAAPAERYAPLPPSAFANGTAVDTTGNIYLADTHGGGLWRVPAERRGPDGTVAGDSVEKWIDHPLLDAVVLEMIGVPFGPNGLQYHDGHLIVTNTGTATIVRVPITPDGAPGEPVPVVRGLGCDDFAVLPDGTLYVTTHPTNWVVRIDPDGVAMQRVAGPDQGVIGSACAAFDPATGDVFVGTDGGLFGFESDRPRGAPSILRLHLD